MQIETNLHENGNGNFGTQKQWLVQKFGGTSIGKFIENITSTIVP
jgi:aspartate kinase